MSGGKSIGLALGGGAARGLCHLGVLQALSENNISIGAVAGTSMGAIIGGLYAAEGDCGAVAGRLRGYLESDLFRGAKLDYLHGRHPVEGEGIFFRFSQMARRGLFYTASLRRPSFITEEDANRHYRALLPDIPIEGTRIPFCATAVDLTTGEPFLFRAGSLRQAVSASCAIPGVLPPVPFGGHLLVDGGWLEAVPVEPARDLGAEVVVAVDVGRDMSEFEPPRSALDIVFRSDAITRRALARERIRSADLVLTPKVGNLHWADFSGVEAAVEAGRRAVTERLPELRRLVAGRRKWFSFSGKGG